MNLVQQAAASNSLRPDHSVGTAVFEREQWPTQALRFMPKESAQFLDLLGKDRSQTWLRFIDPTRSRPSGADHQGVSTRSDLQQIEQRTADGFNVYAVIGNATAGTGKGGAIQDPDITSCPALFVEWDDGADIEAQAQRWQGLGLPEPTVMLATGGRSVHAYWALRKPMAPEPWRVLMARLIEHCDSDRRCKNPARLMRLAGSVYFNKKTGKATGQCRVIASTGVRYDAEAIAQCLPAPAPQKPVAAPPRGQLQPRGIDEINAAAERIPRRVGGEGTYDSDRNALCGCAAALADAGVADPDSAALALLGHLWPTERDAAQVLRSATTRNAASFWAIARENGYQLKRKAQATTSKAKTAGLASGKAIKLRPDQVLELLPARMGALRLNTRTRDVHTDGGVLDANDAGSLYLKLSNHAETWGKEVTADAVALLARQNAFDPVEDFLNGITAGPLPMEQWERLDVHLLGIDDPIAAEFLPRFFISAVARVFMPGCDVRQSPVLVGPQWRGKTALGRILFGAENWISGVGAMDKDALLRLHTAWGVELAELDGVTRRSDQESLKAFLTETCDSIRRPYDRATVRHPRRFVFWGTSNGAALKDATGNTRFVTIPIPDRMLPLEWAEQHRGALWARAVEQYRSGVEWDRCSDATRTAIADRNETFTHQDPWRDAIARALEQRATGGQSPVSVVDLLEAVQLPIDRRRTADGHRVRQIAESLGWVMERRQIAGKRCLGLWPPAPQPVPHQMPQVPHQMPQGATRAKASQANGSDPAATSATSKQEKDPRKGATGRGRESAPAALQEVLGSFDVALVAAPPDPFPRNGSALPQGPENVVAPAENVVAPAENVVAALPLEPGFVSQRADLTGSGADAFGDGDDPHWSRRQGTAA